MKDLYEAPEAEKLLVESADIICTSEEDELNRQE